VNRQTLVERVAAGLDAELLDLGPFLADGIAGWRRYCTMLRGALAVEGSVEDDLPELLAEIGVEPANAYRVMLGRESVL
jgi:hypothetical protein